jgi:hypothetical protein
LVGSKKTRVLFFFHNPLSIVRCRAAAEANVSIVGFWESHKVSKRFCSFTNANNEEPFGERVKGSCMSCFLQTVQPSKLQSGITRRYSSWFFD